MPTLRVLCVIAIASLPLLAQQPEFEAASVRPSAPDATGFSKQLGRGSARYVNYTLRGIIADAYGVSNVASAEAADLSRFKLVGGPNDILSRSFNIDAKGSPSADAAQSRAMLRALLAERFRLRVRTETRQTPVYVLTLARKELGPGMKRSETDCVSLRAKQMQDPKIPRGAPCWADRKEFTADGARPFRSAGSIAHFVERAQQELDRPLIDGTGLTGRFEWSTRYRAPSSEAGVPLFFDAVLQDFGLRFERRTEPYEVYVIESVAMPTPN
jgi:uncharacterized protein (TIGR03435 family)